MKVFLSIRVTWKGSNIGRSYLNRLEGAVHSLAKVFPGVRPGTSFASESQDGKQTEGFTLVVADNSPEDVADKMVSTVRRIGIKEGSSVTQTMSKGEERYARRLFAKRRTKWLPESEIPAPCPAATPKADFPERIQYLSDLVNRYYLVGGKEIEHVFRDDSKLKDFLSSLSRRELSGLRKTYGEIVRRRDDDWIMNWFTEESGGYISNAKAKTLYLLAFLDRLRKGGLLQDKVELEHRSVIDWNRLAG
jgi:hypothetical protein